MSKSVKFLPVIIALAFSVFACRAFAASPFSVDQGIPLERTQVSGYTFDLPANQGWSDTDIQVSKGQMVRIAYISGMVSDSDMAIPDANGSGYVCGQAGCCEPLPLSPRDALIGRVGQDVFYIGNGGMLSMPATGTLQLRINDCDSGLYDNRGILNILVLP